nr:hypothetical protein CFP56_79103 [Quercus suber]
MCGQPHRTLHPASSRVGLRCGTLPAVSVHHRVQHTSVLGEGVEEKLQGNCLVIAATRSLSLWILHRVWWTR